MLAVINNVVAAIKPVPVIYRKPDQSLVKMVTPLGVWNAMRLNKDMQLLEESLPLSVVFDFRTIYNILKNDFYNHVGRVAKFHSKVRDLNEAQIGKVLDWMPEDVRAYIFPWRKADGRLLDKQLRNFLFKSIRPDGNKLHGYTPTEFLLNRIKSAA